MKKLYNLLVVTLYSVVAFLIGGGLVEQALVYDKRSFSTINLLTILSILLLGAHYLMLHYGQRRNQLSTASVFLLCVVDLIAFGVFFLVMTLFTLPIGLFHYIELIVSLDWDSQIYRLLAVFPLLRILSTIRYFKKAV